MKIDTALYNNEKRHELEGYFIVDTILSLSHPGTLGSWFLNPGIGKLQKTIPRNGELPATLCRSVA